MVQDLLRADGGIALLGGLLAVEGARTTAARLLAVCCDDCAANCAVVLTLLPDVAALCLDTDMTATVTACQIFASLAKVSKAKATTALCTEGMEPVLMRLGKCAVSTPKQMKFRIDTVSATADEWKEAQVLATNVIVACCENPKTRHFAVGAVSGDTLFHMLFAEKNKKVRHAASKVIGACLGDSKARARFNVDPQLERLCKFAHDTVGGGKELARFTMEPLNDDGGRRGGGGPADDDDGEFDDPAVRAERDRLRVEASMETRVQMVFYELASLDQDKQEALIMSLTLMAEELDRAETKRIEQLAKIFLAVNAYGWLVPLAQAQPAIAAPTLRMLARLTKVAEVAHTVSDFGAPRALAGLPNPQAKPLPNYVRDTLKDVASREACARILGNCSVSASFQLGVSDGVPRVIARLIDLMWKNPSGGNPTPDTLQHSARCLTTALGYDQSRIDKLPLEWFETVIVPEYRSRGGECRRQLDRLVRRCLSHQPFLDKVTEKFEQSRKTHMLQALINDLYRAGAEERIAAGEKEEDLVTAKTMQLEADGAREGLRPDAVVAALVGDDKCVKPAARVLHPGAGVGLMAHPLAVALGRGGGALECLETSTAGHETLAALAETEGLANMRARQVQSHKPLVLPASEYATYDAVLLSEAGKHLVDAEEYFNALKPYLAEGGVVCLLETRDDLDNMIDDLLQTGFEELAAGEFSRVELAYHTLAVFRVAGRADKPPPAPLPAVVPAHDLKVGATGLLALD